MNRLSISTAALITLTSTVGAQPGPPAIGRPLTDAQVRAAYDTLPLRFEPNVGQMDAQVKFIARGRSGSTLFLTGTAALLALPRAQPLTHGRRPMSS